MDLKRPFRLRNKIQKYDWGSKTAIPSLLGLPPSNTPMAELWMGAHPKAPSEVEIDGRWVRLDELISRYPKDILGEDVANKFSNELPFLFKIIAAERPLSIQAHPNKKQAIEGFEREERLGIPINAPNRNYKDKNHKPEILCAITEFEALKGFRRIEEIIHLMEKAVSKSLKEEIRLLKEKRNKEGLRLFYGSIMKMDKRKKEDALSELLENAKKNEDDPIFSLVIKLNNFFPHDIGIISPLILNRCILRPEEAIFIPAGELHAYIRGVGVELMANSDNVLRGGLTHKHVDVDELLRILKFDYYGNIEIIKPAYKDSEAVYPTPAEEFLLSNIRLRKSKEFISPKKRSIEILIVLEGDAIIKNEKEIMKIKKGDSILIPSAMPSYILEGDAIIYKASVPI